LPTFFLKSIDSSSFKAAASVLWRADVVTTNLKHSCIFYFLTSWRFLRQFPETLESIDEGTIEVLCRSIRRNSSIAAPIAKFLSVYNSKFAKFHKDKKGFFSFNTKRQNLFDSYKGSFLTLDSVYVSAFGHPPRFPEGSSGFCRFLISLTRLNESYSKTLLADLQIASFVVFSKVQAPRAAARFAQMLCRLLPPTDRFPFLLRQLNAIDTCNASAQALNGLCRACLKFCPMNQLQAQVLPLVIQKIREGTLLLMVGMHVSELIYQSASKEQAVEVLEKIMRLLAKTVAKPGMLRVNSDLLSLARSLRQGMKFVQQIEAKFGITTGRVGVKADEVRFVAAQFAENESTMVMAGDLIAFFRI
jgi:hypothetical protein